MTDDRPTVELPKSADRPTVELEPLRSLATHRYSVRRAVTEDERSQMVERVTLGRVVPPTPPKPTWRVEHNEKTVTLRNDTTQLELTHDDARKLAEAILRGR